MGGPLAHREGRVRQVVAEPVARCAVTPAGPGRRTRGTPGSGRRPAGTPRRGTSRPRRAGSHRSARPTRAPARRRLPRAAPRGGVRRAGAGPRASAPTSAASSGSWGATRATYCSNSGRIRSTISSIGDAASPAKNSCWSGDRSSRCQGGSSAGTRAGAATTPTAVTRSGCRAAHASAYGPPTDMPEHGEPFDAEQVGDGRRCRRRRRGGRTPRCRIGRTRAGSPPPGVRRPGRPRRPPGARRAGCPGTRGRRTPPDRTRRRPARGGRAGRPAAGRRPPPSRARSCGAGAEPAVAVGDHHDRDQSGDDLGDAGADAAEQPPPARGRATTREQEGSRSRARRRPSGSART